MHHFLPVALCLGGWKQSLVPSSGHFPLGLYTLMRSPLLEAEQARLPQPFFLRDALLTLPCALQHPPRSFLIAPSPGAPSAAPLSRDPAEPRPRAPGAPFPGAGPAPAPRGCYVTAGGPMAARGGAGPCARLPRRWGQAAAAAGAQRRWSRSRQRRLRSGPAWSAARRR